jgi:hypothetical protein
MEKLDADSVVVTTILLFALFSHVCGSSSLERGWSRSGVVTSLFSMELFVSRALARSMFSSALILDESSAPNAGLKELFPAPGIALGFDKITTVRYAIESEVKQNQGPLT